MIIRAISLWQPWASLMAWGEKHWETRAWPIRYEGWMAIHATKKEPAYVGRYLRSFVGNAPLLRGILEEHAVDTLPLAFDTLPRGCVLAVGYAGRVVRAEEADIDDREREFGDYRPGRWAKQFEPILALPQPVPASGKQGLWSWKIPDDLVTELGIDNRTGEV